jgi:exopolyphosphatase / guanosine-5'-triphosphate,3'-diphosphate pyrophosphatase
MIAAVIDLGTNTSNLVVARINHSDAHILHQGKTYVRLGDQRIVDNLISEDAMHRTLTAVRQQVLTAKQYGAEKIRIIATSAVRQAANQKALIDTIRSHTGIDTEVIDGEREAMLIYYGVRMALNHIEEPAAILDIGGGSNEVIICENGSVHWKGSVPAGMSRIINSFPISDPITKHETARLTHHFEEVHAEALRNCRIAGVKSLIGCSGAFNTLADILESKDPEQDFRRSKEISLSEFDSVYRKIVSSTYQERQHLKGMDPVRTDLIVPALILSRTFIGQTPVNRIIQTSYALREGVLYEMINSAEGPQ